MCHQLLGGPLLCSIRQNLNEFPGPTAQSPSMERFYLSPVPWCPLSYATNQTMYLLLPGRNAITFMLPTRAQHGPVWGIPACSLTLLHTWS